MRRIVEKNNRLFIEVDGQDIEPIAYLSYLPNYADYVDFAKIGKIFIYSKKNIKYC